MRSYFDVIVNKVEPKDVSLDLVGLTFKDQYLSRSDMWRIKKSLTDTIVYKNKKIEFCSGAIRLQVYEMWSTGEKVACGYINEDTKIVFRSSTSMVYLFIQMSSEMWEFDHHGDLYFEKAVNGFLCELFTKWKNKGSNHEVTIVLFSRTYYKATCIDEFPIAVRDCILEDNFGRFYEDFYRVVVQNERFDDWNPVLTLLRKHFYDYPKTVLHKGDMPEGINSTASQGNFLEVLNISLNVFEKHFVDRSFDRTGQMSVVITPGVGVFEVDRELTNITKQRIIDNGVGSDLVCLGEQPLHAVPLLKFHKQRGSIRADDYSMPHTWINLSFYSSNKKTPGSYIPRIKVPKEVVAMVTTGKINIPASNMISVHEESPIPNSILDYDNYDAQVFKLPNNQNKKYSSLQRPIARKKTMSQCSSQPPPNRLTIQRKYSDPELFRSIESVPGSIGQAAHSVSNLFAKSPAINIPARITEHNISHSFGALNIEGGSAARLSNQIDEELCSSLKMGGSSTGTSPCDPQFPAITAKVATMQTGRSLINPFDPSHMKIKRTSNRRRWIHIFPKDPTGLLIQQHHHTKKSLLNENDVATSNDGDELSMKEQAGDTPSLKSKKHATLIWGATGEQQWNAAITTGVDWKSLTLPACLPITTDYFPDERSLRVEHEVASDYGILPGETAEFLTHGTNPKALTTSQVFDELVSQRLSQGFQICVDQEPNIEDGVNLNVANSPRFGGVGSLFRSQSMQEDSTQEYRLSIGRVYHKIKCNGTSIHVSIYRPRHPYAPLQRRYIYRFQAPDMRKYEVARAEFATERLEKYKWSYLDNYIVTRGESVEFPIEENMKYWRFRIFIVPDVHQSVIKMLENNPNSPCDIYAPIPIEDQKKAIDSLIKLFDLIHKRKCEGAGPRKSKTAILHRERLGSNKMSERPGRIGPKMSDISQYDNSNEEADSKYSLQMETSKNESEDKLNISSNYSVIVDQMKCGNKGLKFLNWQCDLPPLTFLSADATSWVIKHIDGISNEEEAITLLDGLVKKELLCHASGKKNHPYIHGFYLFYIVGDQESPWYDGWTFHNKFHEVSIALLDHKQPEASALSNYPVCPPFLLPNLITPPFQRKTSLPSGLNLYEMGRLDIDSKSERWEWGHVSYHAEYSPSRAFEIIVEWLCATGTVLAEMISNWQRKSRTAESNLHLFPVPCDPFASAYSYQRNPLRGPIVITLDVTCLRDGKKEPFEQFPIQTWPHRMLLFQNVILERFGFLPYLTKSSSPFQSQFVHFTGNMFVMVETPGLVAPHNQSKSSLAKSTPFGSAVESETHGFLWIFNYMLTKRWKSVTSGDELLGERFLQDFRDFCSNKNGRLRNLWDSYVTPQSLNSNFS